MRLAGRPWRTLTETVRLGEREYRVVRPARPVGHAALRVADRGGEYLADQEAAADLATAWWLAARSRHSLVHLPLRANAVTCGEEHGGRLADLVLLHHSLAFPASRWKQVRARLHAGTPGTVRPPHDGFPAPTPDDHHRARYAESRDRLDWRVAGDTLFVIGSRRAFEHDADQVRALAEDAPAAVAKDPGEHVCAEIDLGPSDWRPRLRRTGFDLHVVFHAHSPACARELPSGLSPPLRISGRPPVDDPFARPRAIPRALAAVAIGWAATLVHLVAFVAVIFMVVRAEPGDDGAGVALLAAGNILVLAGSLVMLPIGAHRVRKGQADGRVMISAAGAAPMPAFLCCASFVGFAALTYQDAADPDAVRDSLALAGGLCAALASVALIAAIVYLWQPAVTRWFRTTATIVSGPRPSAPGQW